MTTNKGKTGQNWYYQKVLTVQIASSCLRPSTVPWHKLNAIIEVRENNGNQTYLTRITGLLLFNDRASNNDHYYFATAASSLTLYILRTPCDRYWKFRVFLLELTNLMVHTLELSIQLRYFNCSPAFSHVDKCFHSGGITTLNVLKILYDSFICVTKRPLLYHGSITWDLLHLF